MTTYERPSSYAALNGKTILLTGCATGIGRATAILAHENGANLALADWNEKDASSLVSELSSGQTRVLFRKTDVSNWNDVLSFFEKATEEFGNIDAVVSNAGINTGEDLLSDSFDRVTGKLEGPDLKSINVNLIGHIYIVKCALHFFRKWPQAQRQIILTGSAASYLDTPPIYMYCAAKTGLLGLLRGLRTQVEKENVTVNMIAPWMTVTPMLPQEIQDFWGDLPANTAKDVAYALLLPILRETVNGKAFFIAGSEIVELEDKIEETRPHWMGEDLSSHVAEGQRKMMSE